MSEHPPPASPVQTAYGDDLDVGGVSEVAARLQRRIYELTSTWTGAPVEIHRIQETVSRTCAVLESIVRSGSETPLHGASWATTPDQRPLYEQLCRQLAVMKGTLQDLIDIMTSIHSHPHQNAAGFSTRWLLPREKAAVLRMSLSESVYQVLSHLSMLNITVAANIPLEADRLEISGDDHVATDAEFNMKFRHIDFVDLTRGGNKGRADHIHGDDEDEDSKESKEEHKVLRRYEEQKMLMKTAMEAKSREGLRGTRIHANVLRQQQNSRRSHNEREIQHLEQVFEMISPFNYQQVDTAPPHQGSELIHSPSRNRFCSQTYPVLARGLRASEHLGLSTRSPPFPQGCPPSCLCECHSQFRTSRGFLSSFKSTIGSFAFIFSIPTTPCNLSTCISRRTQYIQITYAFPSWLFHAVISATLKDWTVGSPELLLRVHRRIEGGMSPLSTSIFSHITRGDVDSLKRALSRREGSVYDVAGRTGISTLYHALRHRQLDAVELLLHEGADVFHLDDQGLGPYHEALQAMYTSASSLSPNRLAAILPMDRILEAAQLTSLHKIAMGILWTSVAAHISAHGTADVNAGDSTAQTPLHYAAARGNIAIVQSLLDAGADPDAVPHPPSASSSPSWTPLSMAARKSHLAVVEILLQAGADVNKRGKHARTALHDCGPTYRGIEKPTAPPPSSSSSSADTTSVAIARTLLAHGAALDVVDNYGSTVLDTACIVDDARVAAFFLSCGGGVDACHRDWEGSCALSNCIVFDAMRCARLLLALGAARAGVYNVDENGLGTLHYLAAGASARMMRLFAAEAAGAGLDAEMRDGRGRTAVRVWEERGVAGDEALRHAFEDCLRALSLGEAERGHGGGGQDSSSDSEDAEFFDVDEY